MNIRKPCRISQEACVFFSIVIPVCNAKRYLSHSINSVFDQGYSNFEIILVDDGSSDGSETICDEYASKYPEHIKVVHKQNGGSFMARRTGYDTAIGEYVINLDADDLLLPDALHTISSVISNTNADVVQFGFTTDYRVGNKEHPSDVDIDFYPNNCKDNVLRIFCRDISGSQNPMWLKAIRRSCLKPSWDIERFAGISFGDDFLQTLYVLDSAESFCYLDAILYYYRINDSSMTHVYFPNFYKEINRCLDEGMRFARKWEGQYECDDLAVGILASKLDSTAHFAEYMALTNNIPVLDELRSSDVMKNVLQNVQALSLLRTDRRFVINCVKNGNYWLVKLLAKLRNVYRNIRK